MSPEKTSKWNEFYQKTPVDKIPWNKASADFFTKLLESGKLGEGTALDLGCGVGRNSIRLAKAEFDVTGVDISKKAIQHAKENAKKAKVDVKFYAKDATDLSFLKNQKFDLVLDWANLHGIDIEKRDRYAKGVVKHTKRGGVFVLRCFNRQEAFNMDIGVITRLGPIYLFARKDIEKLFSEHFKILRFNQCKAIGYTHRGFDEYLMKRK